MLEDRDYMRSGDYRAPMTLTVKLTIAMVVFFALQCINDVYLKTPAESWLALTRTGLLHGWLWQLLTFQLLHQDLLHIFFNLLVFWWVGRFCEGVLGKSRFLIALFGCGVAGGLLQGILMILAPQHFGFGVVGASAGVSGLLAIFALLAREQEIRFNFIFPMKAITLLYILLAISFFFTLVPTAREGCVAHAAHLGGLLAGIAWIKLGWHHDYNQPPWERWLEAWKTRQNRQPVKFPRTTPTMATAIRKSQASRHDSKVPGPTEFISKEVDPILDKIAAHGIHSLTDEEKKTLEAARNRIEKR